MVEPEYVGQAFHLFSGCCIQSLLGATFVSLYPDPKTAPQLRIPELDEYQPMDAKFMSTGKYHVLMVLAVHVGTGHKNILRIRFDERFTSQYDVTVYQDHSVLSVTQLENGICAMINADEDLELFHAAPGHQARVIHQDPVLGTHMDLLLHQGQVHYIAKDRLYKLKAG